MPAPRHAGVDACEGRIGGLEALDEGPKGSFGVLEDVLELFASERRGLACPSGKLAAEDDEEGGEVRELVRVHGAGMNGLAQFGDFLGEALGVLLGGGEQGGTASRGREEVHGGAHEFHPGGSDEALSGS